ncbi:MAG: phosphodiester glycosidase family protein [Clostridiales bacterium]|nr:phosphodiester glycosidase family protein [Clostridiales bacterium]
MRKWFAGLILFLSCSLMLLCGACAAFPVFRETVTPEPTYTPAPTPTPTATPVPTPTPTPTPVPTPVGLCGGLYDVFTEGEIVQTENSFQSERVAIFYENIVWTQADSPVGRKMSIHVARIYVQDIESLQAFAFTSAIPVRIAAAELNAVLVASGDYFNWRATGLAVRNGEVLRESLDPQRDICIIWRDGSMEHFEIGHYSADIVHDPNIWHLFSFGPNLLDAEGRANTVFHADAVDPDGRPVPYGNPGHYKTSNARMVLGYVAPGYYMLVSVEAAGRVSSGIRIDELATLMESLGCTKAYNLDGGHTARMWFGGEVRCERGSAERFVRDVLAILLP